METIVQKSGNQQLKLATENTKIEYKKTETYSETKEQNIRKKLQNTL